MDEDDTVAELGIADGAKLELANEDEFVDELVSSGLSKHSARTETCLSEIETGQQKF